MGADLITYSVAMPLNGVEKIVNREWARIESALKALKITKETTIKQVVKALGMGSWDYENDLGDIDVDTLIVAIKEDLELVDEFDEEFSARDSSCWQGVVGGVNVVVMYAGEMSWGDTPDGLGFKTIRALWRLGIANSLQEAVMETDGSEPKKTKAVKVGKPKDTVGEIKLVRNRMFRGNDE